MVVSTPSNRRLDAPLAYGECPYCGRAFGANHRCIKELYKNNDYADFMIKDNDKLIGITRVMFLADKL